MPKFLGTKKGYHLFKNDQTGETFEVPSELVDKKMFNELTNYDTPRQSMHNVQNIVKADARQTNTNNRLVQNELPPGPKQHPLYPAASTMRWELTPEQVHATKRAQDEEQVQLNRQNIERFPEPFIGESTPDYGSRMLANTPSAPLAQTAPPAEQLRPVETEGERLKRLLARTGYGSVGRF